MTVNRMGVVTDGAFSANLTVRLDSDCSTEQIRIGDFVIVEGQEQLYFSLITDIQLRSTDDRVRSDLVQSIETRSEIAETDVDAGRTLNLLLVIHRLQRALQQRGSRPLVGVEVAKLFADQANLNLVLQ